MAYQPKSYRKFIATAATATIVASAVAPAASAASVSDFKDVAAKYQDAVSYLVANGITQGTTETTFGTHDNVKRGDAAIWLAKALKLDLTNVPASGFTDTGRYDAAVSALKSEGVLSGKTATTFAPNALLTRGEMAKILANAYELTSDTDVPFTDLGPNFGPYIKALYEYEVTQGKTATTFGTSMNITRGDLAIFLKRAAEVVKTPEVSSVTAVNAAQIEVKFNKPVSAATVVDSNGSIADNVLSISRVDGAGTVSVDNTSLASLSADGKTLTVNAASGSFNNVKFVATVAGDKVKTTDGQFVPKFTSNVLSASDTTAPTVTNVTKLDASRVRVNFSEPLSSAGNWTFKLANGTTADVTPNTANLAKGYVDLTINGSVDAGKEITATIIGASDYAFNLINPNPVTVNFSKGQLDGTKPTVSSVTSHGLNKFEIKFSEEVQGFDGGDLSIDGNALTNYTALNASEVESGEAKVTQDSTDKTKYTVELGTVLSSGIHTVGLNVNAVSDLSGETNAAFSRVVEFKADTVAPKLVSSEVKTESGQEYLYLTFDESVTEKAATSSLSATQVKNYVTVNGALNLSSLQAVSGSDNTKYKVALNDVTFTPAGGSPATVGNGESYTVSLTGAFADSSSNNLGTTSITFARGADTDSTKPAVVKTTDSGETAPQIGSNGIDVVDNDTFQVTFNKAVDGATATNKANYAVNGATVKSATLKPGNVVEVKFEADTITLDGLRNVTISGVKSSSGVVMDSYTTSEYFVENVKPTVTSAALVAPNQVRVVFSEAVEVATVGKEDLSIFVGNAQETEGAGFTVSAADGASAEAFESAFLITLEDALSSTEYAQTINLEVVHGTTAIVDAKGNKVKTGTFGVTK
jgi:S-layer homology domain